MVQNRDSRLARTTGFVGISNSVTVARVALLGKRGTVFSNGENTMKDDNDKDDKIVSFPRKRSPRLTQAMADQIHRLRDVGMMQHDIAARLGINQGRVSEVLTGKRFPPQTPDLFDHAS